MTLRASMNKFFRKSELFALRFFGLILLGTAILKLYSPDEFTSVLISLTNAIQTGVTHISEISFLVIAAEVFIGLLLIFKPTEFISVISALSLFILFLVANAILFTNNSRECGCFGSVVSFSPLAMFLFDSLVILVLSVSLLQKKPDKI